MARATTGRQEIVLAAGVNPRYRRVVATYCAGPGLRLREAPAPDGVLDAEAARTLVGDQTAALVVQSPNFYGCLEDLAAAAEIAHAAGALLVVAADPVNLGVLEAPGRLGADIEVGEGQGLGVPISYGGPYLGVFAAKQDFVRRMPGRLVGATVDLRRSARLRADAADPRAAHPPRQGDVEHLHQRGAVRADGDHLPRHAGQAGPGQRRRAVRRQGPLRRGPPHRRCPACRCASRRRSSRSSCCGCPSSPERVAARLARSNPGGPAAQGFDRRSTTACSSRSPSSERRPRSTASPTRLATAVAACAAGGAELRSADLRAVLARTPRRTRCPSGRPRGEPCAILPAAALRARAAGLARGVRARPRPSLLAPVA